MIKYWTVKDGAIGTAHINRHGVEVDFRPPALVAVTKDIIRFYPPKGQNLNILELTYQITKTGLGSGRKPNTAIKEVSFVFKDTPLRFAVEDKDFYGTDCGPITPESLAFHQAWKIKVMEEKVIRAKALEAQKEAGKSFLDKVKSKWESLSRQERKWVKRFIRNTQKSQSQATQVLKKIDPLGYQWICKEINLQTLSQSLGEKLNIQ